VPEENLLLDFIIIIIFLFLFLLLLLLILFFITSKDSIKVKRKKRHTSMQSITHSSANRPTYGAREDNRGSHTDNPYGRHSIRTCGYTTVLNIIGPFLLTQFFVPSRNDGDDVVWLRSRR